MATKPNKSSGTKVTRIKASDVSAEPKPAKAPAKSSRTTKPAAEPKASKEPKPNVLRSIGGYFAGAWYELRQVHWPNRKATWSMTLALILFTAFFVAVILLLDALFQYLFKLTLG